MRKGIFTGIIGAGMLISMWSLPKTSDAWFGRSERTIELQQGAGLLEIELQPEDGRALKLRKDGPHRWVFDGSTAALVGKPYSIVLRNRSSERLKVVVGVDGLNIYRKNRIIGRADSDTGSVLSPGETRRLRGWQMNQDTAERFVFSPTEWSEGEGRTDSKIGCITVQVYREHRISCFGTGDAQAEEAPSSVGRMMKQALPDPQIGTTSGEEIGSRVRTVSFDSATSYPETWAEIDYGRNQNLHHSIFGLSLISDRRGSRVLEVLPGSIAEDAGLKAGDIVIRVDTEDCPLPERIRRIFERKTSGEYIFLRVQRGRHELSLKIRI